MLCEQLHRNMAVGINLNALELKPFLCEKGLWAIEVVCL